MKVVLFLRISGKDFDPGQGWRSRAWPVPSPTRGVCPAQAVLGAAFQALLCLDEARSFQPCNIYEFQDFFFFWLEL